MKKGMKRRKTMGKGDTEYDAQRKKGEPARSKRSPPNT